MTTRFMMATTAAIVGSASLGAQTPPPMMAGEGWEAFPSVEYVGGDARFPKKLQGTLVITDSSVAFHHCRYYACEVSRKFPIPFVDSVFFSIPLRSIQDVQVSSRVRGASLGSKLMIGMLASDRAQEFVGIVHETESSAEAPIFKTRAATSSAIEAKLRFRLKRLGIILAQPDSTPPSGR